MPTFCLYSKKRNVWPIDSRSQNKC